MKTLLKATCAHLKWVATLMCGVALGSFAMVALLDFIAGIIVKL